MLHSAPFSPDGRRVLSSGVDGLVIEWRIDDTLDELVSWTEANRNLPELTCSEREQFNIEPLCEYNQETSVSSFGKGKASLLEIIL